VTSAFDSREQIVREVHGANSMLRLRYALQQTRTYTIKNVDATPKTLIVQQEGVKEYTVLSPKPAERTSTAYRFEVRIPANGVQSLKVDQERAFSDTTAVTSASPDYLLVLIQNKQLSDAGRSQLQAILDLKRQSAETQSALDASKMQIGDLTEDQTRLRQNIDSLNRVKGEEEQVRQYSGKLADNEGQLAKLRDQRSVLTQRKATQDAELSNAISRMEF
jgi:hypothetical protein